MPTLRATNRTQRLVLGFFAVVWITAVAILITSPGIYDGTLNLGRGAHVVADLAFLILISVLITVVGIGVVKRWRWVFWLIVVAFIFGIVRVVGSALQLMNVLPAGGPAWYIGLQAAIGVVQFLIALAMIAGYRKGGVWAAY